MKEESGSSNLKSDNVQNASGLEPTANQQLIQVIDINKLRNTSNNESYLRPYKFDSKGDYVDLDTAIDSEVINIDGTVTKLLGKDALRYKVSAKVK